ncbi:MAG TPA: hypothetical protein VG826_33615 [Pirellulales bacterium]|nr:hypothetical protein [Pirellulales bacterium]
MKRRSTANQQAAGVSLFPFLAVLLCTMGAMIVVLVVIARHTRVKVAEEARRAASADAGGELTAKREEFQWRIDELKKSREATEKTLADKRTELSHLEEHARRLKDQLEEAVSAREHFSELAAGDARENEDLKKRLARLHIDADRTRTEIEELKRKGGGQGESYAIIPYHGPNETHRRPIYIECRGDAIVLQPEGVVLTGEDFTVDLGPSNPLVSVLRAATDYHNRAALAGRGAGGTPYPLFIIRPDGIETWFVARMAVGSWGSDFGYELVGQDWKFDFPPADPRLTVAMQQAVAEAKARQEMLAKVAPRLSHSNGHAVFRASQRGGIVQVEGSSGGSGRRGRGRPALGSRRGGAGGDGFGRGPGGGGMGGPQFGGTPQRLVATSPQKMGDGPVHSIDGDDNPYASALVGAGKGNGRGGPGAGSGGLGTGGLGEGTPGVQAAGGGRYAGTTPGRGQAGSGPGFGTAGSPGGQRGRTGSGRQSGDGEGYGQQPGETVGEPGIGLAQSGSRGAGSGPGVPNGLASGTGGSPAGDTLAMGGPLGGGAKGFGSRSGGGGTGLGQGGGTGTDLAGQGGDGTQPGDGTGGTQPGAEQIGGMGANGTRPTGTLANGKVPGGMGPGGQVASAAGSGEALLGPTPPGGSGNTRQSAGQPAPGIGVPGNRLARATGTGNSRGSSGPTGSGTSDLNGTDSQGDATAGGPNIAASPNGLAGARVVDNGTATGDSAGGSSSPNGNVGGQSDSGSSAATAGGAAQSGSRGSLARLGNGAGSSANATAQHLAKQNASGGSGQSSMMSGQPSSAMGGGSSSSMQSMQGGMPSPMSNLNFGQQDAQASSKDHKHQREKNWANPDASTTNVPIQRPIHMVCDADHLTLLPEGRGKQGMRVIPLKSKTSESLEDLVSTVWDRIESWGTAGRNMYWRPTLFMEVEPGGERRYRELQALLANSGFDIHGRPRARVLVDPRATGRMR